MDVTQTAFREPDPSLVTTTHVTYALHAAGLAIGAFGASTMIGTFLFGWPSIIAVIINYVKRNDARGTWLESHFTWQIRTFWFALAWSCIVGILGAIFLIVSSASGSGWWGSLCSACGPSIEIASGWMRLRTTVSRRLVV